MRLAKRIDPQSDGPANERAASDVGISMPDYYAILWRTLKTGDYESPQWRNSVFDRARRCWWIKCARGGRRFQIARSVQTDVLDAAIKTIQSEFVRNGSGGGTASEARYESSRLPRPVRPDERAVDGDAADTAPFRFNRIIWGRPFAAGL